MDKPTPFQKAAIVMSGITAGLVNPFSGMIAEAIEEERLVNEIAALANVTPVQLAEFCQSRNYSLEFIKAAIQAGAKLDEESVKRTMEESLQSSNIPDIPLLEVLSWQLDFWEDGLIDVRLEKTRGMYGASRWAIREKGMCLNKAGEWEVEPIPSSRDEEFFTRCRFKDAEEALAFWKQGYKSRFEHYRKGYAHPRLSRYQSNS